MTDLFPWMSQIYRFGPYPHYDESESRSAPVENALGCHRAGRAPDDETLPMYMPVEGWPSADTKGGSRAGRMPRNGWTTFDVRCSPTEYRKNKTKVERFRVSEP